MTKEWDRENVKAFVDEIGTRFIRGPFDVNDRVYEYKLIDKYGEDYCTKKQMKDWGVMLKKVLSN